MLGVSESLGFYNTLYITGLVLLFIVDMVIIYICMHLSVCLQYILRGAQHQRFKGTCATPFSVFSDSIVFPNKKTATRRHTRRKATHTRTWATHQSVHSKKQPFTTFRKRCRKHLSDTSIYGCQDATVRYKHNLASPEPQRHTSEKTRAKPRVE